MKIVHVGDSDRGGGAANAMTRLHGSLRRLGHDSRLLVRNSSAPGSGAETLATRGDADDLFPRVREAVVRQYVELNRTAVTNTHFSVHIDGADASRLPLVESSDIVHLHWTASFQTPADVRALLEAKPVVWTLHDLEPLTGGCHFPAGCDGYADGCSNCLQLVHDPFRIAATTLRDKKALWAGSRPTFIAPSRYLAGLATRSTVAQHAGASVVHIPYGIDVEAFRPRSKAAARLELGIPVDGLYVLCGSNYNAERRKGLALLDRVLATASAGLGPSDVTILTVGEPGLDLDQHAGNRIIQLGRVAADVMPAVYAAADVFLHPSLEDNFPCMLLESLSCGTPAIAFDVGGVAEIVRDEVVGRLTAAGDELAMAAALSKLLRDGHGRQRMSEGARASVEQHFRDGSIARQHADLYGDLVKNPPTRPAPADRSRRTGIEEIFPRWSAACLGHELALAREEAARLADESRAKSEHIAMLEHDVAALSVSTAELQRQVREKEAELTAIHAVAEERKALVEQLHASAVSSQALVGEAQKAVREREELLANIQAMMLEQRAEIELVHEVAAERNSKLNDIHALAASIQASMTHVEQELREREEMLAELQAIMNEQRAEIELVHRVAAERKSKMDDLHASAASIRALVTDLQEKVREREEMLATLQATMNAQHAEIELVHRVAAERKTKVEELDASAASIRALASDLQKELREREDSLAKVQETMGEQRAEIELLYRVAAERQVLIEDLHDVAEQRAAVIERLTAPS